MPLYLFKCGVCGEPEDKLMSYDAMKADSGAIPCGATGCAAGLLSYVPAIGATVGPTSTQRSGSFKVRDRSSSLARHDFVCDRCEHAEEIIVDFNDGETTDPRPCQMEVRPHGSEMWHPCEGTARVRYNVNIDRFSEVFTAGEYFDRGLGVHLTSKSDRRETAKQMGFEPVDGDLDIAGHGKKLQSEHDHDIAEATKIRDKVDHHPAFAEVRRLADRGAFSDGEEETADIHF